MTAVTFTWNDEHLHWQGIIDADTGFSIPFAVHVFIFKNRTDMQAAVEHEGISAFSSTFHRVDDAGVGALMMFNLDDIELSLAAHEATHVTLSHHANIETSRVGAKRWLHEHPESVAEMAGNLTVLVYAKLYEHGVGDG